MLYQFSERDSNLDELLTFVQTCVKYNIKTERYFVRKTLTT